MSSKNCKHSNKDVPKERQMLYILRNFTRIQNELAQAKARIRELSDDELAWQNCQLQNRLEKGQGKYDRLKRAYNQLLAANKKRKAIMEQVWDLIPEDIKQKFEHADTSKFESLLDEIDNEEVV